MTHFVFRPVMSLDIGDLGTATTLEAVGTTQNMKGEKMLDKMSARCVALNVALRRQRSILTALASWPTATAIRSSRPSIPATRKSQPKMNCGTHIITGGTGKYKGITGKNHSRDNGMPALAGVGGYFAMDIPHNTSWEIKSGS